MKWSLDEIDWLIKQLEDMLTDSRLTAEKRRAIPGQIRHLQGIKENLITLLEPRRGMLQ
jgi:hypothetical protein